MALHHELSKIQRIENFINNENPNIILLEEKDIGKIKLEASMLITDYSSMCFDFMFADKPVAFCCLDENSLGEEYVDVETRINIRNAQSRYKELYNICYDINSLMDKIEYYSSNNFILEEEYKKINDTFFTYRKDIRKHLIEAILESPENIPNGVPKIPDGELSVNSTYNFSDPIAVVTTGIYHKLGSDGRWSCGKKATIGFKIENGNAINSKLRIYLKVIPFVNKKHRKQKVELFLNGRLVNKYKFVFDKTKIDRDDKMEIISIPLEDSDCKRDMQELGFRFHNLKSPKKLGISNDRRKLGLRFVSMEIIGS